MLGMTQQDVYRKRQRTQRILWLVFLGLLTWVLVLFYQDKQQRQSLMTDLQGVNYIVMTRDNHVDKVVELRKNDGIWQVLKPYHSEASAAVAETLLAKLQLSCRALPDQALTTTLQFVADIQTNHVGYAIGQLNTAADAVYVKQTTSGQGGAERLLLCDKLVASIALAPALNFIDKRLYRGNLSTIRGSFGQLTDFTGIDLSVLQVAVANQAQIDTTTIAKLTFISDQGEFAYHVLPPGDNHQYLLLFEPKKQLIYAIAANEKLNAVLGL